MLSWKYNKNMSLVRRAWEDKCAGGDLKNCACYICKCWENWVETDYLRVATPKYLSSINATLHNLIKSLNLINSCQGRANLRDHAADWLPLPQWRHHGPVLSSRARTRIKRPTRAQAEAPPPPLPPTADPRGRPGNNRTRLKTLVRLLCSAVGEKLICFWLVFNCVLFWVKLKHFIVC